jgi:hypothetical protein
MDSLTAAGYEVGRGSATAGRIDAVQLDKSVTLTDDALRADLQSAITSGLLKPPNSNRLYVLFVQPNTEVRASDGSVSRTDFLGYHSDFAGHDAFGSIVDIRYAVIAYPGGTVGNASVSGVSAITDLTEVASHEIAEAATDPDVDSGVIGWYDDVLNGEVADITNQRFVMLDGYAVQRVADSHDQAMTPAGATPSQSASFVLLTDERLYEHTVAGWTYLSAGVASVSNQAIDDSGRAMVDVVLNTGLAYEYHDGSGWISLGSGVRDARAGQGVSYVLLRNGNLREYHDTDGSWSGTLATGIAAIDAGTDRFGVNMVDVVSISGTFSMRSDSTGWHSLCSRAQTVSGGAFGVSVVLLRDGWAYEYRQAVNSWTFLGANVTQVAAGADGRGAAIVELVQSNGAVIEIRAGHAPITLTTAVKAVSKPHYGLVDVVRASGNAYEHSAAGWLPLCGFTRNAV